MLLEFKQFITDIGKADVPVPQYDELYKLWKDVEEQYKHDSNLVVFLCASICQEL